MSAWTREKSTASVLQLLSDHKIPAGPVYEPQQTLDDHGLHEAGLFVQNTYPGTPDNSLLVAPLFDSQPNASTHAPRLGEHTNNILQELGYKPIEIEQLLADCVVFQADDSDQGHGKSQQDMVASTT